MRFRSLEHHPSSFRRAVTPLLGSAVLLISGCAGANSAEVESPAMKARASSTTMAPATSDTLGALESPLTYSWYPVIDQIALVHKVTATAEINNQQIVDGKQLTRSIDVTCIGETTTRANKDTRSARLMRQALTKFLYSPATIESLEPPMTLHPNQIIKGVEYRVYKREAFLSDKELDTLSTLLGDDAEARSGNKPKAGKDYSYPSVCLTSVIPGHSDSIPPVPSIAFEDPEPPILRS